MDPRYKDKDTLEGLLNAFTIIANDKPTVAPPDLKSNLKPAHAAFLEGKMTTAGDGNYEYREWAESIYGSDFDRTLTMNFSQKQK